MATATKFARTTEADFTANRFDTAKDKSLTVNATVNFLKSGMNVAKFNKRVYHFFHQTLSMSARYDREGFIDHHFQSEDSQEAFLADVRNRVQSYAMLDTERNSDMAGMFHPDYDGRYAELVGFSEED